MMVNGVGTYWGSEVNVGFTAKGVWVQPENRTAMPQVEWFDFEAVWITIFDETVREESLPDRVVEAIYSLADSVKFEVEE